MSSWRAGYVADLAYMYGFHKELTPATLALVGLVKSVQLPNANSPLNYCELGCGQGFSANLLAAANPHMNFYATDFNPAHIVGAKALAVEAGTPNIHFFDQSFAEFLHEPSLPAQFDIIALHGIYSWINSDVRGTVVEFIRRRLKVGGLVYISYNTLPGWAATAPMRHLMYLHGESHGGPTGSRLDPALAFIESLIACDARYFAANPLVKERFTGLKGMSRNYLAHEYFNEAWTLLYHSQVAAELAEAKLVYVGSADHLDNVDSVNVTNDQYKIMGAIADPTLRETVRDFMTNQQFRRDVFVKGATPVAALQRQNSWLDTRFALMTKREDVPDKVPCVLGQANLQPDLYGPILDGLAKGPRTLRQLFADPSVAALGWLKIPSVLSVLVGSGHVQPALDAKEDNKRANRTKAFNAAVTKRAEHSTDLTHLASPVTGGGVILDRLGQLFVGARASKQPDPAQAVWNILAAQGQNIIKDGKTLETAEENLAELRSRYETFAAKTLGIFQQLGIG